MEKKGSITVFLALILSLLLSLVATSIQSVQAAAARTQILNSITGKNRIRIIIICRIPGMARHLSGRNPGRVLEHFWQHWPCLRQSC